MKILIADDDLTSRVMLEGLSRKWGLDPIVAADGAAAWQIMQNNDSPRLLLLDWEMPELNGIQLCQLIREQEDKTLDPSFIILLTSRSETDDVIAGLDAGANEYIIKPFERTELHARINVGIRVLELQAERRNTEKDLQLFKRIFDTTLEGIILTDNDGVIVNINPAFSEITGFSYEEAIGKNPNILSSGKQSPQFYKNLWQTIHEQGHWHGEVWNRKKHGELYAELLTISVLKDGDDKIVNYVGVFSDITCNKQQQEEMSIMAHYDVLTGLPNRMLFLDRFTQACAHIKRTESQLAICFIDLDNFKPVNDNYGHETGDKLLIEVAIRIKSCIREEDTISRQGGDEFALLLNNIESYEQCEQMLERIHQSLSQPYLINDSIHKISASSGVTLFPNDDGDIDTLLRHADQAMYLAKLSGKNHYRLFNSTDDKETMHRQLQLQGIKKALENDEFTLFYQPKVNMVTGIVFGAEALIRWNHPEKGIVPPLDFLPLIEGSELEIKVGNWVINEALSQLELWNQQGTTVEVSVNISSHHLLSETFLSELDTALAKHSTIDSQCLQLEILESSALGDINAIRTVIKSCQKELGVKVALDDFGTGYSSLTHLRNLPVDTIKIDQSFVRNMIDSPSDFAIIDGIIGLARSFNRFVIAEGVETTEHGLMLLLIGCQEAQGYGIAKPIPAGDYIQWLSDYIPNQKWLDHGSKHLTEKESKIKLFKLATEEWKNKFIANLQSSPEESKHWPIIDSNRCPCINWINRAKQESFFEQEVIEKLTHAHDKLHNVADSLLQRYKNGDFETSNANLHGLQLAFDEMTTALESCYS